MVVGNRFAAEPRHKPELSVKSLSIILPTYNEAGNIRDVITEAVHYVHAAGVAEIEVLVVDDNSPDGTAELVEQMAVEGFKLRVIRRLHDRGLTKSLQAGIDAARHDTVLWFDCDFSHPPKHIPQMIYMMENGYDAVVNSRYVAGAGEQRNGAGGSLQLALSSAFNWTVRFLLDPTFSDYTSGFILVRKKVLQTFPLRGDYGEYFVDLAYRILRSDYTICELPYFAEPRRSGESKTGSGFADFAGKGVHYLRTAACLRWQSLLGRL